MDAGTEEGRIVERWFGDVFTRGDTASVDELCAEWTVHDVIVAGDRVVARYSGRVTYRGGLLGIPSRGQRVTESGIIIFRVEGGRIQEIWPEMSDLQVVIQLGALPVPQREG